MSERYLSANRLLESRFRTIDGATVVLRDLILDAASWEVAFLAAEVEGWAPGRQVLLLPGDIARVDEAGGAVALALDAPALRVSPSLVAGSELGGVGADVAPPRRWRSRWAAGAEPERRGDARPPAPDPVEIPAMRTGDAADMIRAETLCSFGVETADGATLRLLDLLLDDTTWTLAFLELAVGPKSDGRIAERVRQATRCLVPRRDIDWVNRRGQTLHLAVWGDELRSAPLGPHPAAEKGAQVRTLGGRSWHTKP